MSEINFPPIKTLPLFELSHLLPQSALDLAAVIGNSNAEKLICVAGGQKFDFGKGVRITERMKFLEAVLGHETMYKLLAVYGGDCIYIPRCADALRVFEKRRFLAEFNAMKRNGHSDVLAIMWLLPRYGFSDRTAWETMRQHRKGLI